MQIESPHPVESREFFPWGAITFFVGLLIFFAIIWFTLFWIMVSRGPTQ